ncbi:D-alanyl-D-alanine carboxypeptidase/D-alanyl-D-alanine endopeptidase [Actinopolyspora mortivallis]|uniref:D-alanyl-D-alanine carboxypeptidase/D-alanyl-D-alanine-endopeptidase n=1 Tax=Actinopolyspora mortivallis TaxID=33906 RepID=A0A2T0GTH1_ACTMO|nr:D-alanyl-D-alanine carboxypeptidase/D-alanyl-D-alanine-endopeptidase [Actinopolyspora mortivallis]PRW62397.1 D-alanyl-D-alanine carboxypeptidase/D-alanyl-D-alanine-endopeptidase [Actinopolyspora mortivallis]
MPEPQEPEGATGEYAETDVSGEADTGAAAVSGDRDATCSEGNEQEQAPAWPTEDPEEATSGATSEPVPEWPEHDEAAVESTQRLHTAAREPEPEGDREEPESPAGPWPSDPISDPPTTTIPVIGGEGACGSSGIPGTPDERGEGAGGADLFTGNTLAGNVPPTTERPAEPSDFGMPSATLPVFPVAGRTTGSEQPPPPPAPVPPRTPAEDTDSGERSSGEQAVGEQPPAEPVAGEHPPAEQAVREPAATAGEETPADSERPPRRRGLGRKPTVLLSLVGVVVLGCAAVLGTLAWWGGTTPRAHGPALAWLNPSVRGLDSAAPTPTRDGLAAALDGTAARPELGEFGGVVLDSASGKVLWSHHEERAMTPASTNKLLTSCAALLAVDHDFRFRTTVVRGEEPGSLVLVGGGDPTLSSLPEGEESVYPGAARLDELVREIRETTTGEIESIKVDVSRYSGPTLAPGWDPDDVDRGYIAPMRPVMLDGGRDDPTSKVSGRSHEPALDVGRELASRLGVSSESVSTTTVREGSSEVAEVESPPLRELVGKLLRDSDNVLAEAVARQVAIATGHEPSFSGATEAVREVLEEHGFDTSGLRLRDGSGLSEQDRVTPRLLGEVLRTASAPADSPSGASARLRPLLTAVPIAGATGSLAGRYEDGRSAEARGWVRAKTGTLTGVNALAGTVVTEDGRLLGFVFLTNGSRAAQARPLLDRMAAHLHECGCR